MAVVKPFNAMRFNEAKAGALSDLVCPPYDIIPEKQREELIQKSKYNMVNLELPKGENMYEDAAKTLKKWLNEGILKEDEKENFYIYEEEFTVKGETKKIKGFMCLVRLEELSKGVVLPHEETLSKAKTDRFNLMSTTFCNFSQIYSLYIDEVGQTKKVIDKLSSKLADKDFKAGDGVIQRLWIADDKEEIEAIGKQFASRQLFIADGHHRYETALNFKKKLIEDGFIKDENHKGNYVMMMLVDMDNEGLVVFPTHRLLKDLKGFDEKEIINKIQVYFDIEKKDNTSNIEDELSKFAQKKAFALYTGGEGYYLITLKDSSAVKKLMPEKSDAYCGLDVSILHSLILEKIFGIDKENMAKQINLAYTRDTDEAINGVKDKKYECCFILNPTKVREIKDVALAGEKMPQKSTYFYPKIITGLVMNKIMDIL